MTDHKKFKLFHSISLDVAAIALKCTELKTLFQILGHPRIFFFKCYTRCISENEIKLKEWNWVYTLRVLIQEIWKWKIVIRCPEEGKEICKTSFWIYILRNYNWYNLGTWQEYKQKNSSVQKAINTLLFLNGINLSKTCCPWNHGLRPKKFKII